MHRDLNATENPIALRSIVLAVLVLLVAAAGTAAGLTYGAPPVGVLAPAGETLGHPGVYGVSAILTAVGAGATAWTRKRD